MVRTIKDSDIFVYYKLQDEGGNIDIRYIRENGIRIADFNPYDNLLSYYENKDHIINKTLGKKFSIFQSIYKVPEYIIQTKIDRSIFPKLEEITEEDNLFGYIIKYNISEKLFYSPKTNTSFIRLYNYEHFIDNYETVEESDSLILRGDRIFKSSI